MSDTDTLDVFREAVRARLQSQERNHDAFAVRSDPEGVEQTLVIRGRIQAYTLVLEMLEQVCALGES